MPSVLRLDDLILHKLVFELKYRYGFTYLDKCGRTINMLQKNYPEWIHTVDAPNPQNASLISLDNSCILNFSSTKLDLSIERKPGKDAPMKDTDVTKFAEQVDSVGSVIVDQLGLEEFTRIGFRIWYLFPVRTMEDAERWLEELHLYSVSDDLVKSFGGEFEAMSVAIVLQGSDRKFRIAFNGVELQSQVDLGQGILNLRPRSLHKDQREVLLKQERVKKLIHDNPQFAAMIDIDAFQDEPELVQPKDFVLSSYQEFSNRLVQLGGK